MTRSSFLIVVMLALASPASAQSHAAATSAVAKIANAMSAAPAAVAAGATILDWPATPDGESPVLRPGTNGWTCFPDMAETPVDDPMCLDEVWLALFDAWSRHAPYRPTSLGMAYMLQGAADASLTDPFLAEPARGDQWIISGPHVMLVAPAGGLSAALPARPDGGSPYVMWKGTPYEHVMMPVR